MPPTPAAFIPLLCGSCGKKEKETPGSGSGGSPVRAPSAGLGWANVAGERWVRVVPAPGVRCRRPRGGLSGIALLQAGRNFGLGTSSGSRGQEEEREQALGAGRQPGHHGVTGNFWGGGGAAKLGWVTLPVALRLQKWVVRARRGAESRTVSSLGEKHL